MATLDCGGMETTVMNYYRNINRTKIQFDFLLLKLDGREGKKDYYEDEAISLGARIFRRIARSRNPVGVGFALYRILRETPDIYVVHIHHFIPKIAIDVAFAALANIKVRVVYSASALPFQLFKYRKYMPLLRLLSTHMMGASVKAGVSLFGEKAKSKLIISPRARNLEPLRFSPAKREIIREELNLGERFTLICVGNFKYEKNQSFLLDVLVRAIEKQPDLMLLFVGELRDMEDEITAKVAELDLVENVRFLGFREDVADLLQGADVFLLASYIEGLPGAAIEAQTAGLPCLLADVVTEEVKILNSLEFLPILPVNDNYEIWAERMLFYKNFERRDTYEEVRRAGFEIKDAAKWLEDLYINALKEKGVSV
jgi:glycosyltransferase involved in cell wall biosynthesis